MVRRGVAHTRIIRPLLRAGVLAFAFLICHCSVPAFIFFLRGIPAKDFNKFFRFVFFNEWNMQKNQKTKIKAESQAELAMKKISKRANKIINVTSIILEIAFEIILLPLHIVKAILNVIEEMKR